MEKKIIDLRSAFSMNNHYLVKNVKECFDVLNKLLKQKSGVTHDPLFIKDEGGNIRLGYKPQSKGKTHFFSNEVIDGGAEAMDRAIMTQFVIFEGCKEYDCFEEVPMCGAPEEGDECYFTFELDGVQYKYALWHK